MAMEGCVGKSGYSGADDFKTVSNNNENNNESEKKEEPKQHANVYRSLVCETVLAYVFWSLFNGLGPMIWFYPLNELEISGYEVFVVGWLSPCLVGIPRVLALLQNRYSLSALRLLTLASLACFQVQPDTLLRLIVLALGNASSMLVLAATLWNKSSYQRTITFWGLILGLFAIISSRIWFVSFIPTWWSHSSNSAVIAIGAIATIDKIISGEDCLLPTNDASSHQPRWVSTGYGFGSLLFLTQWVFGEVSVPLRWTVRAYPDHGPLPNPWGAVILLSLAVGCWLSFSPVVAKSKAWWMSALFAFTSLYLLPGWQGFLGAVVLAIFTMSIWPEMTDRLTKCPPARTLVVVMITYLVEIFFLVWTVAYNFVPGGVYTRERTDILIGVVMLGIASALFTRPRTREHSSQTAYVKINNTKMPNKAVKVLLVLIVLVGLGGFVNRYDPNRYTTPKTKVREFTSAIWTYHFGYDNKGWPSLEQSAQLLKDTDADIITLLESDASKPFLGNHDLGTWLGEKLGMYVDFGPSTKDHTWGNLILSKYPIVKSTHHLLPSPHGELAPAVTATVNITGSLVDFVVTHMGNDRDTLDRKLQSIFLSEELLKAENPVVFMGYVTSEPFSDSYKQLTGHGLVKDIDDSDMHRWCEYIFYRGLIRLGYARVSHGGLSDTEVQMAKFRIPKDHLNYKDHDVVKTDNSEIKKRHLFNSKFGGFTPSHFYGQSHNFHMWTPKYYTLR